MRKVSHALSLCDVVTQTKVLKRLVAFISKVVLPLSPRPAAPATRTGLD
jgi:hypothetical protein